MPVHELAAIRSHISQIAVLNGARHGLSAGDRQLAWEHLAGELAELGVEAPALLDLEAASQIDGIVLQVEDPATGTEWAVDADGTWTELAADTATSEDGEEADTVVASADSPHLVPWSGVICVEGRLTGDGRLFNQNSLWWDETIMPQDLFAMTRDPEGGAGHDGSEICGRIDRIWREPHPTDRSLNLIMAEGVYDTKLPLGAEVVRLQQQGMLTGVSIDVDSVQVDLSGVEGEVGLLDALMGSDETRFSKGRIRRATVCSIPAFIEARIRPVDDTLVASGEFPQTWTVHTPWTADPATIVASAFGARSETFTSDLVELPPGEVFAKQTYDAYTPARIDADGRVSGHVVPWGECHIGFKDRCVLVAGSDNAYRYARTGHVLTREGDLMPTARVYAQFRAGRRGHAPEHLAAADATAWYEEMSQAVADVVIYDDQFGMQIQGRVRPGITQHQLIALRASDLSPDWRAIRGKRECLAIAAVNVSGFPSRYDRIPALVASAAEQGIDLDLTVLARQMEGTAFVDDGQIVTLVASAANVNRPERSATTALADRLTRIEAELAALRAERFADQAAELLDGVDLTDVETELADQVDEDWAEDDADRELAAELAGEDLSVDEDDAELAAELDAVFAGLEAEAGSCDSGGCTACSACLAAAAS